MPSPIDPVETWTVAVEADTSGLQREFKAAASLGRQFSGVMIDAFQGIAIKGKGLGDVLRQMTLRLSDLVLKAAFRPLEQGIGNAIGGLLSGGMAFAKGGIVHKGLPVPFAAGGIVQSPIAFPMRGGRLGIAGERGPEAILPLSRGPDGRLGIAARGAGQGVSVTLNIQTPDAESFRRSETQVAAMISRAAALGQRNL